MSTLAGAVLVASPTARAVADDGSPTAADIELAERYAPIVMLKQQQEACDPVGEAFQPAPVDVVVGNPQVSVRQVGDGNPVAEWGPNAAEMAVYGDGFFLDFPGIALEPGCLYERDFRRFSTGDPAATEMGRPTVYAHIVEPADGSDLLFVQYWFYWYYNDWNNKHESDWEGIAVVFRAPDATAALTRVPIGVGYSQHEGGERAEWDDPKLQRVGDRPVVYPSAGSHASYFGSSLHLGRSGSEGVGCDDSSGPSRRADPTVVVLPDRADATSEFAWLAFTGRWGERHDGPFNGPTGPATKARWDDPTDWWADLRDSSVSLPANSNNLPQAVEMFCGLMEWGSDELISLTVSPVKTGALFAAIAAGLVFLVTRTAWGVTSLVPLVRRRRAGQIIRTAGREYSRNPFHYMSFGVLYVVCLVPAVLLVRVAGALPVVGPIFDLFAEGDGALTFLVAGGLTQTVVMFVVAAALAGALADDDASTPSLGIADDLHRIWGRRRDLVLAYARQFVIVGGLAITGIGLPWAIRSLVRFQFSAPVVMVERLDGKAALARSAELTRGRWLHTATFGILVGALVAGGAAAASLATLVLIPSLPLWAGTVAGAIAFAALVPLWALSMCQLYGDATAEAAAHAAA